jgi:hypothetical protein
MITMLNSDRTAGTIEGLMLMIGVIPQLFTNVYVCISDSVCSIAQLVIFSDTDETAPTSNL